MREVNSGIRVGHHGPGTCRDLEAIVHQGSFS
jgi:hypothetical protein